MDAWRRAPVHSPGKARSARRHPLRAAALLCIAAAPACRAPVPKATLETRSAAESATRDGEWRAAADRWYGIFLAAGGADARACLETARALIELGDPQSASAIVDFGRVHFPDDVALLEMKARALVASGFGRGAEDWYQRALASEPDRVSCLRELARQRMALGMESGAVPLLERLVELGHGDYETWYLLAQAQQAADDPVAAYDAWCHAFTLAEGEVVDQVRAAALCLDERVREARPDAIQRSVRWLEHAIERDPQCTHAHFQLGVLCEQTGEDERAVSSYRRAVETDPACLVALTNLAILYARLGDEQGTREMVELALELETDEPRRRALVRLLDAFGVDEPSPP